MFKLVSDVPSSVINNTWIHELLTPSDIHECPRLSGIDHLTYYLVKGAKDVAAINQDKFGDQVDVMRGISLLPKLRNQLNILIHEFQGSPIGTGPVMYLHSGDAPKRQALAVELDTQIKELKEKIKAYESTLDLEERDFQQLLPVYKLAYLFLLEDLKIPLSAEKTNSLICCLSRDLGMPEYWPDTLHDVETLKSVVQKLNGNSPLQDAIGPLLKFREGVMGFMESQYTPQGTDSYVPPASFKEAKVARDTLALSSRSTKKAKAPKKSQLVDTELSKEDKRKAAYLLQCFYQSTHLNEKEKILIINNLWNLNLSERLDVKDIGRVIDLVRYAKLRHLLNTSGICGATCVELVKSADTLPRITEEKGGDKKEPELGPAIAGRKKHAAAAKAEPIDMSIDYGQSERAEQRYQLPANSDKMSSDQVIADFKAWCTKNNKIFCVLENEHDHAQSVNYNYFYVDRDVFNSIFAAVPNAKDIFTTQSAIAPKGRPGIVLRKGQRGIQEYVTHSFKLIKVDVQLDVRIDDGFLSQQFPGEKETVTLNFRRFVKGKGHGNKYSH